MPQAPGPTKPGDKNRHRVPRQDQRDRDAIGRAVALMTMAFEMLGAKNPAACAFAALCLAHRMDADRVDGPVTKSVTGLGKNCHPAIRASSPAPMGNEGQRT